MNDGSWMDKYVAALPKILTGKRRMIEKGITRAQAKCPICGVENGLQLRLAPNRRDKSGYHVHAGCASCGFSIME